MFAEHTFSLVWLTSCKLILIFATQVILAGTLAPALGIVMTWFLHNVFVLS